jgi:DNA-binding beta-propeller fold protein YncE
MPRIGETFLGMWVNHVTIELSRRLLRPHVRGNAALEIFRRAHQTSKTEIPMTSQCISIRWIVLLFASLVASNSAAVELPSPALLVVLRTESALAIVDPVTEKVVGRVPTGKSPHEITVSADGKVAFVSSPNDGTITVIDLAAQKELRRIDIGRNSVVHGLHFANGKVYFTAQGYKLIGRYDPATNTMDWLLGIGQDRTHVLVLSKDMNRIFTANGDSDSVSLLEGVSAGPPNWKLTTIPVGGKNPEGIDLSPDEKELWIATRGDGGVSILDVATKKVAKAFDLQTKDANRLVFTPDGKRVLISDDEGGQVVVLDAVARKEVKRIQVAASHIMILPDGSRAYAAAASEGNVVEIDLKTLEIARRIRIGSRPNNLAWVETK